MPDPIPNILHQIWVGGAPLPDSAARLADLWRRLHPNWDVRLWTDENLPEIEHRAIYDATVIPAQRADILRYELIARFGGIYADTDFEPLRNLDDLVRGADYFYADECAERPAIGILGSTPGHPFARWCVDRIPERFPWGPNGILEETGPHFFARAVFDYLAEFDQEPFADPRTGRRAGNRLIPRSGRAPIHSLLPWTVYPYYLNEAWVPADHPDAYAVHHWDKNW